MVMSRFYFSALVFFFFIFFDEDIRERSLLLYLLFIDVLLRYFAYLSAPQICFVI
jgi:hypothetical protein